MENNEKMTQEEQAKAYNKVREKIALRFGPNVAEELFSEFEMSDDERMVKFIKKQLFNIKKTITENYELDAKLTKAIEWLEKQGEQKPVDMTIKEKAHQIAWESSKQYDPTLSKECWCEMAALDMASWLEKQGKHKDYYTKQELIDMGFSFTLNGDIVTPDEMMEDMKKYLAWKEKQGNKPKKVEDEIQQQGLRN